LTVTDHPKSIEYVFTQSVMNLDRLGELSKDILFQDGTKVESRANKYTFVWKGAIETNLPKLKAKVEKLLAEVKEVYGWSIAFKNNLEDVLHQLKEMMELNFTFLIPTKSGSGHRLTVEQRFYRQIVCYLDKSKEYRTNLELIGEGRRSMSKTDCDATFMRMKDDYMRNGQRKPAYNIQNLVDSGYVVGCYSSNDRSDYNTMIPALKKLMSYYPWKYKAYCADSGYDSLANHIALRDLGITNYIKPQNYELSKTRKFKKDIGLHQNMYYNEEHDYYVCKASKRLVAVGSKSSKRKYGPQTKVTIYKCKRGCVSCKFRKECMSRNKGKYKTLYVDHQFNSFQKENLENIISDFGTEVRINRSIQVEGTFAQIKSNLFFTRFKSFGYQRTTSEWILMCLAMNSIRLAARSDQGLIGKPFWHSLLDSEVS
jgi:hypothetical protein